MSDKKDVETDKTVSDNKKPSVKKVMVFMEYIKLMGGHVD